MENCIIENSPTSIEDLLSYYSTMKTTENNENNENYWEQWEQWKLLRTTENNENYWEQWDYNKAALIKVNNCHFVRSYLALCAEKICVIQFTRTNFTQSILFVTA